MNNKIGIITQYYKSHNYGGLLQAYALVKAINQLGYNVEQICYNGQDENYQRLFNPDFSLNVKSKNIIRCAKDFIRSFLEKSISRDLQKRFAKMDCFGDIIPHSEIVYTKETTTQLPKEYTHFVVGSDQVWNPQFYAPVYFCDFAKGTNTKCISYAASVSQKQLTERQAEIYKEHMKNFSAISLRENNTEIIQELTDTKVEWVLDPTLLLTREDWDAICSERLIQEPYLFCYFLGNDAVERQLAEKFAKAKKCKLVTVPHLSGTFEKADFGFGDKKMISAGPEELLSLIKYADFVFTDSFHATVFSHIYKKQFFVFQRAGMKGMSTRIETLLSLFENKDRFCNTSQRQTMDYLMSCKDVDFTNESKKYKIKTEESIDFIRIALDDKAL